jgi:hypothetical protein
MPLLAISLLTIFAGTLLLAKFKKEMAGKFFVYISWFFIVVGFLLFIGFIAGGIYKIKHHGFPGKHCFRHEMKMGRAHPFMQKGLCCPGGMKDSLCCPGGMPKEMCMHKGMCMQKPGCMMHDSLMICCPKHMKGDSVTMIIKKE